MIKIQIKHNKKKRTKNRKRSFVFFVNMGSNVRSNNS